MIVVIYFSSSIKIKKNLLISKSGRTKERALIEKINMSYKSFFFFLYYFFSLLYPIETGVTIEYDYCCPSAGIT